MKFFQQIIFKIKIKPSIIVLIITFIGFLLRIGNPTYASPILYALSDEASNYMSALYMISQKTLITKAAVYPPLGAYIQIPFLLLAFLVSIISGKYANLSELQFFLVTHEGYFLFVPRIISGILGTLTIPVIYLISKELFPKKNKILILSTFLFALSFNHLHVSHFNRPWAGLVFSYSLTILFSLKCLTQKTNKYRNYLLSGLFAGLSFGFHYAGLFAILIFLFTILPFSLSKSFRILRNKEILVSILIFLILTLGFNSLIESKVSSDFFAPAIANYKNEGLHILIGKLIRDISILGLLKQLFVIDPVITLLGISALFIKRLWMSPFKGLTIFTIFYLLMASLFIHMSARYLMPLIIILSIYSGFLLFTILDKIKSTYVKYLVLTIIVFISLINPIDWNYVYFQEPTFIQLRKWVENNIKPEVPIGFTSYRMAGFLPSKEVIKTVQIKNPRYYNRLSEILSKTSDQFPNNVRAVYYLEQIMDKDDQIIEIIENYRIKYIIDYYWNPSDAILNSTNLHKFKLIKHFSPLKKGYSNIPIFNIAFHILNSSNNNFLFYVDRSGPYIDVLGVKN